MEWAAESGNDNIVKLLLEYELKEKGIRGGLLIGALAAGRLFRIFGAGFRFPFWGLAATFVLSMFTGLRMRALNRKIRMRRKAIR